MIPLPNLSVLIDAITNGSANWFAALLPLTGLIIGVSAVFIIGSLIMNKIYDLLDWNDEKSDLLEEKSAFQHLLGGRTGAEAFEVSRLLDNVGSTGRKLSIPRDMLAGVSLFSMLRPEKYNNPLGLFPIAGWKPGGRIAFDRALMEKNKEEVEKLLSDVPKEYQKRMADRINQITN